jgi:hypothetical protein
MEGGELWGRAAILRSHGTPSRPLDHLLYGRSAKTVGISYNPFIIKNATRGIHKHALKATRAMDTKPSAPRSSGTGLWPKEPYSLCQCGEASV